MTALSLTLTRTPADAEQPAATPPPSRLLIPLVRLEVDSVMEPASSSEPTPARSSEVLTPWCKLAEDSPEPCLVLDIAGVVVAVSAAAAELLGEYGPDQVVGHHLLDVVDLVDFHGGAVGAAYADRLPPLMAVAGDALARGLLRVRFPDGATRTLDAVAAPLHESDGQVVGTIAFLASIWS